MIQTRPSACVSFTKIVGSCDSYGIASVGVDRLRFALSRDGIAMTGLILDELALLLGRDSKGSFSHSKGSFSSSLDHGSKAKEPPV